VFFEKLNYEPRKLAKTMGIFVEIEHIKNHGSHFGPRESDTFFPCYGAVTKFDRICDQTHDCSIVGEIAVQFFWAKM
jgi:hypothetical protein